MGYDYSDLHMFMGHMCLSMPGDGDETWLLSLPGNIVFVIVFASLLQPIIYLAFHHRIPSTGVFLTLGITTEILGHAARVYSSLDRFSDPFFFMGYITLMLAPTFIAAGLYCCLSRVMVVFEGDDALVKAKGKGKWLSQARGYTGLLMGLQGIALIVLAVGTGTRASLRDQVPTQIITAGLGLQLVTLLLFVGISIFLGLKWKRQAAQGMLSTKHSSVYTSLKFKISLSAIALATTCITIRTIFRLLEHACALGGFRIFPTELRVLYLRNTFMILESTMMAIACLAVTIGHPGLGLGGEIWREGGFFGKGKKVVVLGDEEVVQEVAKEEQSSFESVRGDVMAVAK